MTPRERVARGAALLDEQRPGWWERTDVVRLEMSSTCNCMLGLEFQREWMADPDYGTAYQVGVEFLRRDLDEDDDFEDYSVVEWCQEHGFERDLDVDDDYANLRTEWLRVIEQRRSGS